VAQSILALAWAAALAFWWLIERTSTTLSRRPRLPQPDLPLRKASPV
jgi:hypothetical protein